MASYLSYIYIAVSRLSNHPNLVGILTILLENPQSWLICDRHRDRKNPDFDTGSVIFKWILRILILIQEHLTHTQLKLVSIKTYKKLHMKI